MTLTDVLTGEEFVVPPDPAWILRQDDVWIDAQRKEHKLGDIDARYAQNIVEFLRRRASGLHSYGCRYALDLMFSPIGPRGNMAQLAAEHELADLMDEDALEWLERQPLVVALRRIVASEHAPGHSVMRARAVLS